MKDAKGFSIIELLLVVAIITIVPMVVISNFPQTKRQFALSESTFAFAQQVRKVQAMALAQAPYQDTFGIVQQVAGYGMYLDLSKVGNTKYIVYADAAPGNQKYDAADYIVGEYFIENSQEGVVIADIQQVFSRAADINFAFSRETTITALNQNQDAAYVVFGLAADPKKTKSVLIHTSGLIEVK